MATKKQNTKTTAAKTTKATSTISLPKVPAKTTAGIITNTTLPKKVTKAAAPKTQSNVATLVAQQVNPNQVLANAVTKHKGALVPSIVQYFTQQALNTSCLNNKTTTAVLYHAFMAFNGKTNMLAIANSHSCMPAHYYKKGATIGCINSFVNDAKKAAHYACSAFNTIYNGQYKAAHIKAFTVLSLNQTIVNPLLTLWAKHLNITGFKASAFWAHIAKASA